MTQSINLIPQKERQEQTKTQIVKVSTVVSVIIAVVVSIVSAVFFYQSYKLKQEIKLIEDRMTGLRADITASSQAEISARNLEVKAKTLKSIFESRTYYSYVLEELKKRIPADVTVESFAVSGTGTITLSGQGENYLSVAKFVNNLVDKNYSSAGENLKALFTGVTLNSVGLEDKNNRAKFSLLITFDEGLIKGK